MENFYAVIMAGGGGTRLWPLSRRERPKQTLRLIEEKPLFTIAVDRISPLIPLDRIFVVTVEDQAEQLQTLVPKLPTSNFILEPSPKGTASVVGLAAVVLDSRNPDSVMAVLTADHFIKKENTFREMLKAAYEIASLGELVTLGICPTYPSTGYGYIQRGEELGAVNGFQYFRSLGFREKPPANVAEEYVSSGDYSWNSGMFIWKSKRILEEIHQHMPKLSSGLDEIKTAIEGPSLSEVLKLVWERLESQTVDYGIMEKAKRVVVLPANNLGWIDIGNWDRMFEVLETDDSGNIVFSDSSLLVNTTGSMVVTEGDKRLIALLGVKDLVVVDAGDVLLVCNRDHAEDVRKIVRMLSEQGKDIYL